MSKSIEEKVEDFFKNQLNHEGIKYFTKTESMNPSIDKALQDAPSKSGGTGKNYPDIRCLLEDSKLRRVPVMIEAKGREGELIKLDKGVVVGVTTYEKDTKTHKKGDPNYSAIQKFAVNGAVHYATAVLNGKAAEECLDVGINGWNDASGDMKTEVSVWYVSNENQKLPKEVGKYSDLTFLKDADALTRRIDTLKLTQEEIDALTLKTEAELDKKLRNVNQVMQDTLQINVNYRVNLISGMIMAGLGVDGAVPPLKTDELNGYTSDKLHDGRKILDRISDFLDQKKLPDAKRQMIVNNLAHVFIYDTLWKPVNGESKLKSIYKMIESEIMPIFNSASQLDFTGKLFNVLNEWVTVPDGDKNDVVLTPRYVTDMMAKLCRVNKDSHVWDYATGSGGFLVSSMKLMLEDARERIKSPAELQKKELQIKLEQLLGVEKLSDIYMLAVLNMILMGDGSSKILHANSLTEYDGTYKYGEDADGNDISHKKFPADVLLLNPPYSADGKGLVFVKKALDRMDHGWAAVLIQENAGSGNGLPYTKELLEHNTLVASIHMSDIFCGKASVQTAIYVFQVGASHDKDSIVKFIDMSDDGYTRQNRKKSSQDVNLRNTGDAKGRYAEVVDIVLGRKKKTDYYNAENGAYIEDTIDLEGNDWTFAQHKKVDLMPTEEDFRKTVADYLSWRVSQVIGGAING